MGKIGGKCYVNFASLLIVHGLDFGENLFSSFLVGIRFGGNSFWRKLILAGIRFGGNLFWREIIFSGNSFLAETCFELVFGGLLAFQHKMNSLRQKGYVWLASLTCSIPTKNLDHNDDH